MQSNLMDSFSSRVTSRCIPPHDGNFPMRNVLASQGYVLVRFNSKWLTAHRYTCYFLLPGMHTKYCSIQMTLLVVYFQPGYFYANLFK